MLAQACQAAFKNGSLYQVPLEAVCGSFGARQIVSSRRSQRQEETRFYIMRLLSENPEVSTREIANYVGISNGAAYYCVKALVEKGLVKLENFNLSSNKRTYSYILTPKGIREKSLLTLRFIERKKQEYRTLRSEIELLEREADSTAVGTKKNSDKSYADRDDCVVNEIKIRID